MLRNSYGAQDSLTTNGSPAPKAKSLEHEETQLLNKLFNLSCSCFLRRKLAANSINHQAKRSPASGPARPLALVLCSVSLGKKRERLKLPQIHILLL